MYLVIGRFQSSHPVDALFQELRTAGYTADEFRIEPRHEAVAVIIRSKDFARRDAALGLLKHHGALEVWAEEKSL